MDVQEEEKKPHHGGLLAGRVVYKGERNIEVIEVHFALGLKLVEEVEETKCERGARASESCRKPAGTKELATAGGRFRPVVIT
jgi:hypothetical protein